MKKYGFILAAATAALLLIPACEKSDGGEGPGDGYKIKVGTWYFGGWSFPPDANGYTFHISQIGRAHV